MRPTCPRPIRPSVLSATSTPLNLLRCHSPARRVLSAAGMCLAAASMSPKVCSPAAIVLLSGALATMMPRLVAAPMSMLSTPIPARPMVLRFSACSMTSAVTFVTLRMISPSYSPIFSRSSSGESPRSTSTSNSCFSSSTPLSARASVMSTFTKLSPAPGEDPLRRPNAAAQLHRIIERLQRQFGGGYSGDNVVRIEVAAMTDAEDLTLHRTLPAGDLYSVLAEHQPHQRLAVDPLRHPRRRDRRVHVLVGTKEL